MRTLLSDLVSEVLEPLLESNEEPFLEKQTELEHFLPIFVLQQDLEYFQIAEVYLRFEFICDTESHVKIQMFAFQKAVHPLQIILIKVFLHEVNERISQHIQVVFEDVH